MVVLMHVKFRSGRISIKPGDFIIFITFLGWRETGESFWDSLLNQILGSDSRFLMIFPDLVIGREI